MLELINRTIRYGSHISIEVVDTTLADAGDIHQTDCTEDGVAVPRQEELLLPNLHINSKGGGPSWCVEGLFIGT
jgi:hypothetical protein